MNLSVNKIIILILFISHSSIGNDVKLKKGWTKPNAWQKDNSYVETDIGSNCECLPKEENKLQSGNSISLVFYKKLLLMLFDRNSYIKENNEFLKRGISIKISENDLNILEKSSDPKDWDEIVTKVFKNVESIDFEGFENSYSKSFGNVLDNFNFFLNNSWSSYFKLNSITILLFIIIPVIFLHTKYGYNLIAISLLAMFLVGYVNEYKICNSELGIEKLVDLLDDSRHNPCQGFDIQGSDIKKIQRPWYDFWSKPSKKEECAEHLRKQNKKADDSDWCTPDDVLLRYISNVFKQQFDMVIHKSIDVLQKVMDMPFPWNYFGGGLFMFLITTFLGLFYKYVVAVFITSVPSLKSDSQLNNNSQSNSQPKDNHERFHEMLLLQSDSINKLANVLTNQPVINIGSGVQIIEKVKTPEPITAPEEPTVELNETEENKTDINENKNEKNTNITEIVDDSQKS